MLDWMLYVVVLDGSEVKVARLAPLARSVEIRI